MQKALRLSSGLGVMLVALLAPVALGQSDSLQQAFDLYEAQEYQAAQDALLAIDVDQLTTDEVQQRDDMLKQVADAVAGSAKAQQDSATADEAYASGDWDTAETLYDQVLANDYASDAQQTHALERQDQIVAKRTLAEAAKPSGPVEDAPAENIESMETIESEPVYVEETEPEVVEIEIETIETIEAAPAAQPVVVKPAPAEQPSITPRLTRVEQMQQRDDLLWQRAMAKMRDYIVQAQKAAAANNYEEAMSLANAAKDVIETNKQYAAPATKYESALAQAIAATNELADQYESYKDTQTAVAQIEAARRLEARTRIVEENRQARINQLFDEVDALRAQNRYEEAVDKLNEIIHIDPSNAEARTLLPWVGQFASIQRQNERKQQRAALTVNALEDVDIAQQPWTQPYIYPENWLEVAGRRGPTGPSDEDRRKSLDRILDTPIDQFQLEENELNLILEYIRERYDLPIDGDWPALEEIEVYKDTLVEAFDMKNTDLRTVISELLRRVGSQVDARLSLDFLPGRLLIVPHEKLSVYPHTYNVLPFLYREQDDEDDIFGDTTGGGGGFDGGGGGGDNDREDFLDDLAELEGLIRGVVGEDNWPETSSIVAMPEYYLMISQTYENHKLIAEFLRTAEGPGAGPGGGGYLQASFETRFLTVTNNFLEDIGVDLDFVFNSGNAGYDVLPGQTDPVTGASILVPREFSRAGAYASPVSYGVPFGSSLTSANQPYGAAAFVPSQGSVVPFGSSRMTPMSTQQGSAAMTSPSNLATGIPGSFSDVTAPALSIAGSFLDNLQVDFLIRATQANRRSSVISAPRLIVANGQRGQLYFGTSTNYVSGLTGVPDSIFPTVQVGTVATGTILQFSRLVISPNMKYINSRIRINQAPRPQIDVFDISTNPRSTVGLPVVETNQIDTMASIPDGGTLLIGGLKQSAEIEVEAGVPILSKIPVLKRAFTNTSKIKDTLTTLILIKGDIVIPNEAEETAFPTSKEGDNRGY